MSQPRILVTSAAGHTGAAAVKELLTRGFQVRAFVRQIDARSEALSAQGAEIFAGNIFDYRDLRAAMKGVQRAYHCPPFGPNLLQSNMLFAIAAEEAKLEMVAVLESWNAHPTHPSDVTREHWISRQIVDWMPSVDVVHIAPGLFAFTYFFDVQTIRNLGLLLLPFGNSKNAPPANEDIGAVVAAVIADPAGHVGKLYRPTGPQLLTPSDVAAVCERILGRSVRYYDISTKMFTKAAIALGMSSFEVSHLRYFVEEHQKGAFAISAPTDHVEIVTGRPPESFEETAKRYLENPALVHRRFKIGGKLGAIKTMLKTAFTKAPNLDAFERSRMVPMIHDPQLAHESTEWLHGIERFESRNKAAPSKPMIYPVQSERGRKIVG